MLKQFFSLVALSVIYCIASCATENVAGTLPPNPGTGEPASGDVLVYTTTSSRSRDLARTWLNFGAKSNMSPLTIYLQPEKQFQTMDGFGAAITGSAAYNLMQMPQAERTKFLTETFDPVNGFGFSYIRVSIGCSDFSLSEYTCCDEEGIEHFALRDEDLSYVIPVLQQIVRIHPGIKIMGSPWTCPLWMKVNNNTQKQPYRSWTGGHLNSNYYQDYATYFVKWVKAFADHGVPIYSLTPQNEPRHDGTHYFAYEAPAMSVVSYKW
jgi:glucosylceramidase